MQRIIVIPARMESKRLPGKPLLDICGKSLVHRTYEVAERVQPDQLVVASPDDEVLHAVERFGGKAVWTHLNHPSGTHRSAQAMWEIWDGDDNTLVMSLQADEPLIDHCELIRMFDIAEYKRYQILTLVSPIPDGPLGVSMSTDRNLVKVAYERTQCFWFSRAMVGNYGHVGVYLFTAKELAAVAALNLTLLSKAEALEQLTWLEAGHEIHALEVDKMPLAVNTQYDLDKVREEVEHWKGGQDEC